MEQMHLPNMVFGLFEWRNERFVTLLEIPLLRLHISEIIVAFVLVHYKLSSSLIVFSFMVYFKSM